MGTGMSWSVSLHPDVVEYLNALSHGEKKRCYRSLKKLGDDPHTARSGCDIMKMTARRPYFRLRVGDHRFLYVIDGNEVLVEEGFRRGKGY